jgi:hypothetical protein
MNDTKLDIEPTVYHGTNKNHQGWVIIDHAVVAQGKNFVVKTPVGKISCDVVTARVYGSDYIVHAG